MVKFKLPPDAGEWFKFPPDWENKEGHTGPWMGVCVKKTKSGDNYMGQPELAWHVVFSRAGCERTIVTRVIEKCCFSRFQ